MALALCLTPQLWSVGSFDSRQQVPAINSIPGVKLTIVLFQFEVLDLTFALCVALWHTHMPHPVSHCFKILARTLARSATICGIAWCHVGVSWPNLSCVLMPCVLGTRSLDAGLLHLGLSYQCVDVPSGQWWLLQDGWYRVTVVHADCWPDWCSGWRVLGSRLHTVGMQWVLSPSCCVVVYTLFFWNACCLHMAYM